MNQVLSKDEYEALTQISKTSTTERPSACVARNAKRLSGLKYAAFKKDGSMMLTDKGKEALFIKQCIDGLRAVASDPLASLDNGVITFLGKKGHISQNADTGGFSLTQKGRESLDSIDSNPV